MKKIIVLVAFIILSGCFVHKHIKESIKSKEYPRKELPFHPIEMPSDEIIFPEIPELQEIVPDRIPPEPQEEPSGWWFSWKK